MSNPARPLAGPFLGLALATALAITPGASCASTLPGGEAVRGAGGGAGGPVLRVQTLPQTLPDALAALRRLAAATPDLTHASLAQLVALRSALEAVAEADPASDLAARILLQDVVEGIDIRALHAAITLAESRPQADPMPDPVPDPAATNRANLGPDLGTDPTPAAPVEDPAARLATHLSAHLPPLPTEAARLTYRIRLDATGALEDLPERRQGQGSETGLKTLEVAALKALLLADPYPAALGPGEYRVLFGPEGVQVTRLDGPPPAPVPDAEPSEQGGTSIPNVVVGHFPDDMRPRRRPEPPADPTPDPAPDTVPDPVPDPAPAAQVITPTGPAPVLGDVLVDLKTRVALCHRGNLHGLPDDTRAALRITVTLDGKLAALQGFADPDQGREAQLLLQAARRMVEGCADLRPGHGGASYDLVISPWRVLTVTRSGPGAANPLLAPRREGRLTPAAPQPRTEVAATHGAAEHPSEAPVTLTEATRRELQARLTVLGFDPGGVDGDLGPNSLAALQAWQVARGHAASGTLLADQWIQMRAESEAAYQDWRARQPARPTRPRVICQGRVLGVAYGCRPAGG